MDLRTVVTVSTLLLLTAASDQTTRNTTISPSTTQTTSRTCTCSSPGPAATTDPSSTSSSPARLLGLLTIRWVSTCEGDVIVHYLSNSSYPVCYGSETIIQRVFRDVCKDKRGCRDAPRWETSGATEDGSDITERRPGKKICHTLKVHCSVEALPDVGLQQQLYAYKVVTALLCCVLLVLFLLRFTRPSVRALQKRLSDRRQNRWIGPTQSHSVSYQRGKGAVKNNDGDMRLSYPALERLTVSDSREPSSNRNSDYNF